MIVIGNVVYGIAFRRAIDGRRIMDCVFWMRLESSFSVGQDRTGGRSTNNFAAFVRVVEVPHTDCTIAATCNDLVFVELAAINAVGMAREIDGLWL